MYNPSELRIMRKKAEQEWIKQFEKDNKTTLEELNNILEEAALDCKHCVKVSISKNVNRKNLILYLNFKWFTVNLIEHTNDFYVCWNVEFNDLEDVLTDFITDVMDQ